MTVITGGLRARLVHDSLFRMVRDGLDALGWFDAGGQHAPLQMVAKAFHVDETVPINTIAIEDVTSTDEAMELGSNLTQDTWTYYVDFYAEGESLGLHVIGDVRDILRGKIEAIGRRGPVLDVYDYRSNPAPRLFVCDIENVMTDRAHGFPHAWQRYWFSVRFDIVDAYGTDYDGEAPTFEDLGAGVTFEELHG